MTARVGNSPVSPRGAEGTGAERVGSGEALARVELAVRRRGAVLVGDAGIGKSFAARAVATRLHARGVTVEFVLATKAASTVPFGALAGLLEPFSGGAGDLLEVLRSTGDRLVRRARGGKPVVIIDDAHWLDPASAALLLALVMRHGVRVLATVREGAAAPDAVTSLWKDAGASRVDLAPLSESATADVAGDLLGGPVERGAPLAMGDQRRQPVVPPRTGCLRAQTRGTGPGARALAAGRVDPAAGTPARSARRTHRCADVPGTPLAL